MKPAPADILRALTAMPQWSGMPAYLPEDQQPVADWLIAERLVEKSDADIFGVCYTLTPLGMVFRAKAQRLEAAGALEQIFTAAKELDELPF